MILQWTEYLCLCAVLGVVQNCFVRKPEPEGPDINEFFTTKEPVVTGGPLYKQPVGTPPPEDIIPRFLGKVSHQEWTPFGYFEIGGGPVRDNQHLDCDFESQCCYRNAPPPGDKLEWRLIRGTPDSRLMLNHFKTGAVPYGQYLVVGSPGAEDPFAEARFVSCTIFCTDQEVKVTLRHWATEDVELRVCTRDSFIYERANSPLLNCRSLPNRAAPGPTEVILPPGEIFDIVIVASHFLYSSGGMAIIDDIQVDYLLCRDVLEPQPRYIPQPPTESIPTFTDRPPLPPIPFPPQTQPPPQQRLTPPPPPLPVLPVIPEFPLPEQITPPPPTRPPLPPPAPITSGTFPPPPPLPSLPPVLYKTPSPPTNQGGACAHVPPFQPGADTCANPYEVIVDGCLTIKCERQGVGSEPTVKPVLPHPRQIRPTSPRTPSPIRTRRTDPPRPITRPVTRPPFFRTRPTHRPRPITRPVTRPVLVRTRPTQRPQPITRPVTQSPTTRDRCAHVAIPRGIDKCRNPVEVLIDGCLTIQCRPSADASVDSLQHECNAIECNFERGNLCSYKDAVTHKKQLVGATQRFLINRGRFQNSLTGIRRAAEGVYYLAAYLDGVGSTAALEVSAHLTDDRVIAFDYYLAVQDIELFACCDGATKCPFRTSRQVSTQARTWKRARITCTGGTRKLVFYCRNDGLNQGACGIDNIQLLSKEQEPICQTFKKS